MSDQDRRQFEVKLHRAGEVVARERGTETPTNVVDAELPPVDDLDHLTTEPVGRCIYCGSAHELTREHIVPFGLSGTAVLPMASCRDCARVTGQFEAQVLRGPMRAVRVLRRLRSRTKHADAPATQSLKILRDGQLETVHLPLDQYPVLLHFPVFAPPRIVSNRDGSGIELTGVATVSFGPRPQDVLRRLSSKQMVLDAQGYQPTAFARMLAKIAYSLAVAKRQMAPLDPAAPLLRSILGLEDEIGRWVGTLPDPIRRYRGLLHRIAFRTDAQRQLTAEVQLFADSETPSYAVILGAPLLNRRPPMV